MTDPLQFVTAVLSSAGVAAALLAVAAWLAREWIGNRLSGRIRHEYDAKLAELNARLKLQGESTAMNLKAEVDRLSERRRQSAQALSEVQKATIERRLLAVEEVWAATVTAQKAMPSVFVFLDVLLDKEYPEAINNPKTGPELKAVDAFQIIEEALAKNASVVKRRPFVGNYLWVLYSTYQSTLFRMIYLVSQCEEKPEKLFWFSDSLIRRYIQAALGDELLKEFESLNISRVTWVHSQFTKAMLEAMDSLVAGHEYGEATIHQAKRMEALLLESAARRQG
ncbi:hypothetical protein DBR47_08570 [Paucibacter sp. KBW04]|uniref:hypothetical protein n=1 Tax=Paucibacter sp. KBW04 TaxID=2153361 RepID=UPI000F580003|nr:hypothetical protein [Paucibacter sp. KBW04]RQO60407.1 hypothetical protein DBR47_08570 [Paucibacter sp. KBW04]